MKKTALVIILLSGCFWKSYAQTDALATDAPSGKSEKTIDQYVGVQLNDLIKQVLNFNSTTATTTTPVNPYLLTYSINQRKTGWGIRLGVGYNYNSTYSNDGITETSTKINDLQLRLGIEKAFKLSDKWSAGAGIDFIYNNFNDNTTNTVSSTDTTTTSTKDVTTSFGGGAMGWLRYHLTDKIMIGTEASFYYVTGNEKQTIDVTGTTIDPNTGLPITSTTETVSKPTVSQGTFTSPIVFYITVKF
jgi:hypothetical protein